MIEYCGVRAQYYKNHSCLCMLPLHDDKVDHLVEMVTVDTVRVRYNKMFNR